MKQELDTKIPYPILEKIFLKIFPENKLVFDVFLKTLLDYRKQDKSGRLEMIFKVLDGDDDGLITPSDLAEFISMQRNHQIVLNDRVRIKYENRIGILRFLGTTQFAEGIWAGIELSEGIGKNNGTVEGVEYFKCPENTGLFVLKDFLESTTIWEEAAAILDLIGSREGVNCTQFVNKCSQDSWLVAKLLITKI